MIEIPDKVWRVWQESWGSGVSGDEELAHLLLAEIWEESWKCLTTDGTFIPYCIVKERLSSIDVEKLITQFRGKSVRPLVHTLEKTYHCYQTQGNSGTMGNTTCDRAEDSEELHIGGNSTKDRSK